MAALRIFEALTFHSSSKLMHQKVIMKQCGESSDRDPAPYGVLKGIPDRVGGRGVNGGPLEEVTPKHPASQRRGELNDRGEGLARVGLLCLKKSPEKELGPTGSLVLPDEGRGG